MKILYIDMDNVLVDFQSGIDRLDSQTVGLFAGRLDEVLGIFSLMDPMPRALRHLTFSLRILIPTFCRLRLG
jgi:hypothetical protein